MLRHRNYWVKALLALSIMGMTLCFKASASENRLSDLLEDLRTKHGLIALAGVVLQHGRIVEIAAVGHRKKDDPTPVTADDRWHLGSNAKAMTATMIARLVERGVLDWGAPMTELLSEHADMIHPGYRDVTFDHLLTHRAGLPANFPLFSRFSRPPIDDELPKKRLKAVLKVLAKEPVSQPGTAHLYSNVGYTLAGVIAEQTTGSSWERLMQQEVFAPLEMTSADFGAPGVSERLDQPWGHQVIVGSFKRAAAPGPWADNDATIGPAGTIHMSLSDWARFVDEHLHGEFGESSLLGTLTFERLHRPTLESYAYGWVVQPSSDLAGGDPMLWHNGSNTMWYSLAMLWPDHDTAFLFASNDGALKPADRAMKEAAGQLAECYLDP